MSNWQRWTTENHVSADALIEHWSGLVRGIANNVARAYKLSDDDRDDLVQECYLKLLKMPESARPHIVYARTTIKNAIRTGITKHMSRGGCPLKNWQDYSTTDYESAVAGHNAEDEVLSPIDYLASLPCPEVAIVDGITLADALATLTPRERLCVDQQRTATDIAVEMGCTVSNVGMIRRRALAKLRKRLVSYGD